MAQTLKALPYKMPPPKSASKAPARASLKPSAAKAAAKPSAAKAAVKPAAYKAPAKAAVKPSARQIGAAKKELHTVEAIEAVILSGPRKGEIVTLQTGESSLSAADQAMLKVAHKAYAGAAHSATETVAAAKRLNQELDEIHGRLHGRVRDAD